MAAELLALKDIHLTFGGTPLLDGVDLSVRPGDRIALVGRNGSGKSTLLKIAAGQIEADSGDVFSSPGATVRYLPQEPDLSGFETVLAYVEAGLTGGDPMHRAQYLVDHLSLDSDKDPRTLSGGEARRAALARTLAPEPDILLLDEPTNHLDLPAIEWLESELSALRSAFVLISHDRRFLTDLTRQTIWLDRGVARTLNEGFSGFEAWRDKVLDEEDEARHKLDRGNRTRGALGPLRRHRPPQAQCAAHVRTGRSQAEAPRCQTGDGQCFPVGRDWQDLGPDRHRRRWSVQEL